MKKTKIVTVVGTRPELIRLARVIPRFDAAFDHILVHTGQNYDYELNGIFFEDLELRKPDHFLNAARKSPVATMAQVIEGTDRVLDATSPDGLLVLGDTNSCLAALAAKRRKIPVFHMEAGNRCFDQRVPEEINRKIVDHISDINMPYSSIAREYLLREGIPPDRVIKTGSPMAEVIAYYLPKIERSRVLSDLGLAAKQYFLVSCHREENVDIPGHLGQFVASLNLIARIHHLPIIVSTHPRTRKRLEEGRVELDGLVRTLMPLGFSDYVNLERNARLVLSDSGTITEESSILRFPALNIREAHERPEGMEEAAVIMTGLKPERVLEGMRLAEQQAGDAPGLEIVRDYDVPNVSVKVARIVFSYIEYVRQNVWKAFD
jgi:UDP-N-acetylglucosamine 2-epimerase